MKKDSKGLLSPNEISTFCAQIAMILKAGIPVAEGVTIMCEDMKNPDGRKILEGIKAKTELGEPLNVALDVSGRFPPYVVDMVRIGEQSGRLDEVMDSLCNYYEREESVAKSIKSAISYPMIMVIMMLVVIGILITQVLPVFLEVYAQLGNDTPFVKNIINMGGAVVACVAIIILIILILFGVMLILKRSKKGRNALSRFKSWFFVTKNITTKISSGRFAAAMSLMMSSGLDVDQSLDMAEKLVDNVKTSEKLTFCKKLTKEGLSFSEALTRAEIFSGVYARMIAVGFKTGSVDSVMKKLSERYEEEVDTQIDKLISILEPTLVAVLSVIVGAILLSVMLPLMGIMSSIG